MIGEGAFLGVASVILPGITIGAHAIVGAGSVVTKNVRERVAVAGVPARELAKEVERRFG